MATTSGYGNFLPSRARSLKHRAGQTNDTAKAFDDWAGHWSSHYSSNGAMAGRIVRFADVLAGLNDKQGRVLDFGCGTGEITRALADQGWALTGCDLSSEMLLKAGAADTDEKVTWTPINVDRPTPLPFPDALFTAVYSSSVFEYLSDPQDVIRDIHRTLLPGGYLFFTVPDTRHPIRKKETIKALFAKFPPFWALIKRTRWQSEFWYLRISVNRSDVSYWHHMLTAEGFTVSPLSVCCDPLVLIVAQKIS
jgi:SAM-dependent methyltransferase